MNVCAEDISSAVGTGLAAREPDPRTFNRAVAKMESAVVEACQAQADWPARISAGIAAAVDFVVGDPVSARALTVDSRAISSGGESGYAEMVARFAALLGAGAPRSERLPASSDESVVWVIAAIVGCHVRAGTVDALAKGDPDLIFLALLPYVGFAEASRWSAAI